MLKSISGQELILKNSDHTIKRFTLFFVAIAIWFLSEIYLRPMCGDTIQAMRKFLGNSIFVQHLLSQSLPVDIVCFFMLLIFCSMKVIPKPQFVGSWSPVAREGTLWGVLICIPTIPLGVYLGFKLGFAPNLQGILGNIISNFYEELTYRFFLFSMAAYAFRNIWVGVVVSAFLFAWIHSQYPISMQIVVGLAGVAFSLAYIRSRNLFGALWAHQLSDIILDSILF